MSKRFTDSEKWKDPWFRKLPIEYKLFWLFILDMCDVSGVWKVDIELAGHYIMGDWKYYKREECLKIFNERIYSFDEKDSEKWFIKKFIDFQYGELSKESRPHIKVINLLNKYGLESILNDTLSHRVCHRVCHRVSHTLKDKDKDKDKDNKGGYGGNFEDLIPESLKQLNGFISAWVEWIKYRKQTKHTISQITAKKQIKMLSEHPDAVACIEQSITHGWQGLFSVKQTGGQNDKQKSTNFLEPPKEKYTGI